MKLAGIGATVAIIACGSAQTQPVPTPQAATPSASSEAQATTPRGGKSDSSLDVFVPMMRATVTESFSPQRGDAALKAFVPDLPADLTTGECNLMRTSGSGATIVIAYFPTRAHPQMQMTLSFDSAGHLVRFSERRGIPKNPPLSNMTPAQRDSTIRVNNDALRSTDVSLDYALDQAMLMNRGGGRPINAIMGTVRAVESLEQLGPPKAHVERARRLCAV